MTGVFNAKRLVIWHTIAPTYAAMIVIIMDMLPWTAQIRYCHLVHQHATGLTPMIGVGDPPLDITATPDAHAMTTETDLDSATLDLTPATTAIEVIATMTLAEVTPDHSTDLPTAASHVTGALVPTAPLPHDTPHHRPSSHRNTSRDDSRLQHRSRKQHYRPAQGSSSTSQASSWNHKDKRHKQSPLMTHCQSTTAPMTMKVTQTMI